MNLIDNRLPTPEQLNTAFITGDWKDLKVRPKSGCNSCLGRGYAGKNITTGRYVVCQCILRQLEKLKVKI